MFKLKPYKIFILILGVLVLIAVVLSVILVIFFKKEEPAQEKLSQKQEEIQKIQELLKKTQKQGNKESLITISKGGFSQSEIRIKPNTFISFYNSTDQEVKIDSATIKPGVTASIRFKEGKEISLQDKILKIIIE